MSATAPTVSVVTPFYNTGTFLAQCIRSVLAQTFQDFEYILVDNQSTDDGGRIAAEFAAQHDQIKLIRTPRFLSQVDNFNFALRQISPESTYCKMVLADDWLYPQCLADMVALADAHRDARTRELLHALRHDALECRAFGRAIGFLRARDRPEPTWWMERSSSGTTPR